MYVDLSKLGLLVALLFGVYFGWNPWWVPAVFITWLYSFFVYLPWFGKKKRAAALEVYRKQYLESVMGRNEAKPEELN